MVVETGAGNISAALANNPNAASLGGTATVAAASGVATFAGLTLDKAGAGLSLQVTGSGLARDSTASVTVDAAPSTQLVVATAPPASVTAGGGFGLVVRAEDAFGNVDPTFNGSITAALANNPAGGTLGGLSTVKAASGVATFTGLTLNKSATGDTLKISGGGLSVATKISLTVNAAPARQLVIVIQPPASVTAGSGFGLVAMAEDPFGNVDPTFNGNVAATLAGNPAAGNLTGSSTVAATLGVATFANLALDRAGTGDTLQVSSGSLSPATSASFTVNPAPASRLVVATQPPGSVTIGSGFGLVVDAMDPFGNLDTSFDGSVSLALASNPGGTTIGGTPTATAGAGVATFSGVLLYKVGAGYTLQASSGGLSTATTSAITVNPAPASQLVIASPPPGSVTAGSGFGLVVTALDPYGDVDPNFSGNVSLALGGGAGGASLGGSTTVSATAGVAAFAGLTLNPAANNAVLQVTGTGLTGTESGAIGVIPPPTTVVSIALQNQPAGKHKTTTVIAIQFDNALNAAAVPDLSAYSLTTMAQGKKHPSKPLALAQSSYNPATDTLTLTPAKKLVLSPPLQLRIVASVLTDAEGRPLDGNHDGQPGGDFVATLSKGGAVISSAVRSTAVKPLFAHAIDELFATGFRPHARKRRP